MINLSMKLYILPPNTAREMEEQGGYLTGMDRIDRIERDYN